MKYGTTVKVRDYYFLSSVTSEEENNIIYQEQSILGKKVIWPEMAGLNG